MKYHPINIYVPIWDTRLYIRFRNKNSKRELKNLQFTTEEIDKVLEESCQALTYTNEAGKTIIFVNFYENHYNLLGTLIHELFHATQNILEERDVKLRTGDGNEPYAYLMGYLAEKILKRLDKSSKKT